MWPADMFSGVSVTVFLVVGIVSLLAYRIWQRIEDLKTFEKLGIPSPRPNLFLGSLPTLLKKGFVTCFVEWKKQYGKAFGMYMIGKHALVVTDPDLLRDIMVKKFPFFTNRVSQKFMNYKPWNDSLLQLTDDHWKHVRSALSPTFSSGKIKKMVPAIQRIVKNLDKYIETKAEAGEEVELKCLASRFTMDTIAGAAFGMEVDAINNPDEPFNVHGRDLQNQRTWLLPLIIYFPWLSDFLRKFLGLGFVSTTAVQYFMNVMDVAIKEKREDKIYSDFLHLLVGSQEKGDAHKGPIDTEIDFTDQLATSAEWNRKTLTEDEMKSNGFLFLLAGYDTVSVVLAFTLFFLAAHPEVLHKAQEEVDTKLGKNLVTYDSANQLTYLDMCINESLRMFSPAILINRDVNSDVLIGEFQVKKGMQITIPIHALHKDPEYWPDPDRFDPERHTPEAKAARHPFTFLPFGMGPRNCIGMRLAQLEIRMAIGAILQKYAPVLCDKSVYPPVLAMPESRATAKDDLWVKFKPRD